MPSASEEARAFNDEWGPPQVQFSEGAAPADLRERELVGRLGREGETMDILAQLAELCAESNRKEDARVYLEKAVGLAPGSQNLARLFHCVGLRYEVLGEFEEAIVWYGRAVDQHTDDEEIAYFAHNNLAYCLNLYRRHSEAERLCRIAIWIEPRRHNAHKNLGISLQGMNRPVEAAQAFLTANRLFPLDDRAARHFFTLLNEHPEVGEAIPDWKVRVEGFKTDDADIE